MMTRVLAALFAFSILLPSGPIHADPFEIPDDQSLAMTTYAECNRHNTESESHDCTCIAMRYVDLKNDLLDRTFRFGGTEDDARYNWMRNSSRLRDVALADCVDRAKIAMNSFSQCRELNIVARADYNEYCACYAMTFADKWANKRPEQLVERYSLMADAMIACDPARNRKTKSTH